MTKLHELEIPSGVYEEGEAHELVRFWVGGGTDHVTLNISLFDGEKEPSVWGSVAADIVKHAVNGMLQDDPTRDSNALFAEIERSFVARLKEQTNFTGQLGGNRN